MMKRRKEASMRLEDWGEISFPVDRRNFLKINTVLMSGLFLSGTGLSQLSGCGYKAGLKPGPCRRVVLHNFRLFDGVQNQLQEGRRVVIEEDRIRDVDPWAGQKGIPDYQVIDAQGMTLMPGLIDNHVHITVPFMFKVNLNALAQMDRQIELNFRNCIMNGVTTVRDVGGFPGKIKKFREMSDRSEIPGPRVISSLSPIAARKGSSLGAPEKAPYFTNPLIKWLLGGNYAERPTNVEEIREACERMVKLGAQWLKTLHQDHTYSYYPRTLPNHSDEGYRTILEIGRKYGLKCALHQVFLSGFKKGVDLGFHTLDHMPMDEEIPDDNLDRFNEKNMAILPTMMIYGDCLVDDEILVRVEKRGSDYLVPEAQRQVTGLLQESLAQEKKKLSEDDRKKLMYDRQYWKDQFPKVIQNLQKLHRKGATVGIGTDIGGSYSGFFGRYLDELKHYQAAGISNFEILRMATAVNARILNLEDKIGTVEKGRWADLIVVEGNPLDDLRALEKVRMVMKGGVLIKNELPSQG